MHIGKKFDEDGEVSNEKRQSDRSNFKFYSN